MQHWNSGEQRGFGEGCIDKSLEWHLRNTLYCWYSQGLATVRSLIRETKYPEACSYTVAMPQRQPKNANSNLKPWQSKRDWEELWLEGCKAYVKIGGGRFWASFRQLRISHLNMKRWIFSVNSFTWIGNIWNQGQFLLLSPFLLCWGTNVKLRMYSIKNMFICRYVYSCIYSMYMCIYLLFT